MASTTFAAFDAAILGPVEVFISNASHGVSNWATTPLAAAFTLYVAVHGGAILLGKISDPVSEFLVSVVRYGFILTIIGTAGRYSDWVVDLFFKSLPREIASALATGQAPSASAFDALIDQGMTAAAVLWKTGGSWDVGGSIVNGLAGFVIFVFTALLAASGYAAWIFSKVALALCLAVGPAFVALAAFKSTRRFTESWLATLANYVILQVLVVALLSLLLHVFRAQMAMNTGTDALAMLMVTIPLSLCGLYLFHQLPAVASALAGGGAALGYGWSARRDANESAMVRSGAAAEAAHRRSAGRRWAKPSRRPAATSSR
jgi:type IV secretion system protein VirB6